MSLVASPETTPRTAGAASLDVRGLRVDFGVDAARVLDGVDVTVAPGEALALVGESGSGKSMTAMSVMRLLPRGARMTADTLTFDGQDLLHATERQMSQVRGGRLGMLFQQPKRMLDPTCTVGSQVAEPLRRHLGMNHARARARVVELLHDVGIPEPENRAKAYAHQLSGGIAQRVMIAMALAGQPELLIADEPTTALDVTVEAQILRLIAAKKAELGMSVLFISHDLHVVSAVADRIAVMYAGRIVEMGPAQQILSRPEHPYTRALTRCSQLEHDEPGHLFAIDGDVTSTRTVTTGCRFLPRCKLSRTEGIEETCQQQEPDLKSLGKTGVACRCWARERGGARS